jgi:hypothetical protein
MTGRDRVAPGADDVSADTRRFRQLHFLLRLFFNHGALCYYVNHASSSVLLLHFMNASKDKSSDENSA